MNKYILFLFLILSACSTKKIVEAPIDDRPSWVKEYPVSSDYYIGIGIADRSKHPENYIQVAQQNALQNLSAQIKVNIATESVFLQMEREYAFEEDFKSNIKVNAKEYLEQYELVGSYTHTNEYWVYYRLNKALHNEIREARISEAIDEAKNYLEKAVSNIKKKEKFIFYVKALEVLEPYLSEPLTTEFERQKVYLGSEIIARFRSFMDDYKIYSLNKKIKCMVGDKIGSIKLAVQYQDERQENIPLNIYSEDFEMNHFSSSTDEKGIFLTSIPKITSTDPLQKAIIGINFYEWVEEATKKEFIKKLIVGIKTHQINLAIHVYTPSIYVESDEKYFGKNTKDFSLKFATESALAKNGFTATSNKNEADLFMTIDSDTQKGKVLQGQKMYTSFLSLTIQVKDKKGMVVFSRQKQKIKGIQLDFELANSKAYEAASKLIEKEIVDEFINQFTK